MALGRAERQGSFDDAGLLLGDQLAEGSIYRLLAGHGDALFGDLCVGRDPRGDYGQSQRATPGRTTSSAGAPASMPWSTSRMRTETLRCGGLFSSREAKARP
jgi:hypothetical protein